MIEFIQKEDYNARYSQNSLPRSIGIESILFPKDQESALQYRMRLVRIINEEDTDPEKISLTRLITLRQRDSHILFVYDCELDERLQILFDFLESKGNKL
jgi:hypothetical protein